MKVPYWQVSDVRSLHDESNQEVKKSTSIKDSEIIMSQENCSIFIFN